MTRTYTTGDISKHFGCDVWQVLQAMKRGFLEEPPRVGIYRYWTESDLSRIRRALEAAGYLPAKDPVLVGGPGESAERDRKVDKRDA